MSDGQQKSIVTSSNAGAAWPLFLASFAALYFELVVIRFLSTEIRVFAYLKNLALIACFFGIGLGMVLQSPPQKLKRRFHWIAAGLLLLINFAPRIGLTFLPIPTFDYRVFTTIPDIATKSPAVQWLMSSGYTVIYIVVATAILVLVVGFFVMLGALVGETIQPLRSLRGYGINLAGSLAGIAAFTALSFFDTPPVVWVALGFLAIAYYFRTQRLTLAIFAATVIAMAFSGSGAYWSPYYRITFTEVTPPAGWSKPSAYLLDVNHLFHQRVIDLSPEFVRRFPNALPNAYGRPTYELPYQLVPKPQRVLVIGAGTGNDVAAALRHGASHIDAVEIDPRILWLGRKFHPEHPYDSPRVTAYNDDARSFLRKSHPGYDLIVFGYLDSHTMLSSMSSIRLDNYVYTVQSFRDARRLLNPTGSLVLGFSAGKTFIGDRLYATLAEAFQQEPLAYFTGLDATGIQFVVGNAAQNAPNIGFPEISQEFRAHQSQAVLLTDHWPFLYLQSRTVPVAIWSVLAVFLYVSIDMLSRQTSLRGLATRHGMHLFFLGAGFMLLETKSVTELSLLFGSTWIVNSVVVAAFLIMAILANFLTMLRPFSTRVAYVFLFLVLVASLGVSYASFGTLPSAVRIAISALLAALPVFFSGLIFSASFKSVERPAEALGVNLLGAVVGGVLENLVMIGGTPLLAVLAIVLYGLSASFAPRISALEPGAAPIAETA